MQKVLSIVLVTCFIFFFSFPDLAQVSAERIVKADSARIYNPKTAAIRSAILPGLGQAYNRRYWKIPVVYAALGITSGILVYNVRTYNDLKAAYINKVDGDDSNDDQIPPEYITLSPEALRSYRNTFRQNIDYSVLFLLIFWGLNVVDATVDAHLRSFDINDNLNVGFKAGYSPMANLNGVSIVMNIGKRGSK